MDTFYASDLDELKSKAVFKEMDLHENGNLGDKLLNELNFCDAELKQLWKKQKEMETELIEEQDLAWKRESAHRQRLGELERAVKTLEEENRDLSRQVTSVQEQMAACEEDLNEARATEVRLAQKALIENERDKSIVELLENVTQTQWEKKQSPDKLQGVVISESNVKPFSLNLKELSQRDVMDKLWGQLSEGEKFKLGL